MGLDVWFRDDVARILAGTAETMTATQAAVPALDEGQAEVYQQGFLDAIHAVAVAFGVAAPVRSGGNGCRRAVSMVDLQRLPGEHWRSLIEEPWQR